MIMDCRLCRDQGLPLMMMTKFGRCRMMPSRLLMS
jgi:hypothetical protein